MNPSQIQILTLLIIPTAPNVNFLNIEILKKSDLFLVLNPINITSLILPINRAYFIF